MNLVRIINPIAAGFLFMQFNTAVFSQNLVPNPGFDTINYCPTAFSQVTGAAHWYPSTNNWTPPNGTDYMNSCGAATWSVPNNFWGTQAASSGSAYMSMSMMAPTLYANYRENIYAQLISALVPGHSYTFSAKISRSDFCQHATNNFGAKFSTVHDFPINNTCQYANTTVVTSTTSWTTVSGSFIADSAYTYICIGNFYDDAHTTVTTPCGGCSLIYYEYYIDDVSLVECIALPVPVVQTGSTCLGDTVTFSATGATSYNWSSGSIIATGDSVSFVVNDTMNVILNAINSSGCSSSQTYVVFPFYPAGLTLSYPPVICGNDSVFISATGAVSYQWNDSTTTFDVSSFNYWVSSPTLLNLEASDSNGCHIDTSLSISFYPKPVIGISLTGNPCYGDTIALSLNGAATYVVTNGVNNYSGSSISIPFSGESYFTIMATDSNGCVSDTAFSLLDSGISNDSVNLITLPSDVCFGDSVFIQVNSIAGLTYNWTNGSTSLSGNVIYVPANEDTLVYSLLGIDTAGCLKIDTAFYIPVYDYPDADISVDSILTGCAKNEYHIFTTFADGFNYDWTINGINFTGSIVNIIPESDTVLTIALTVNNHGCKDSSQFTLPATVGDTLAPPLTLPNVFTPNGDDQNDILHFSAPSQINFSVKIYNRWGELLHQQESPENGWDGTYKGNQVSDGAYLYVLTYSDPCAGTSEIKTVKGWIFLFK